MSIYINMALEQILGFKFNLETTLFAYIMIILYFLIT